MGLFNSRAKKEKPPTKVGDLFFYATLILFFIFSLYCILTFPRIVFSGALGSIGFLILGAVLGAFFAAFFIRSYFSVFLHELKHMIVALMSGNRAKGIKVSKESGHFEYEYTADNESYNAFIALAPYYVPLFTIPFLVALPFLTLSNNLLVLGVGFAYGVDLLICMRDISPYQTDFSNIRGGYYPGLLYVISLHIIFASVLLVWTATGLEGLEQFFTLIFTSIAHVTGMGQR